MSLASILGLSLLAATIAVLYPGLEVAHRTGNFLQKLPPPQGIDRCLIKAELQGCEVSMSKFESQQHFFFVHILLRF